MTGALPSNLARPRFYFALPRLIALSCGGSAARTETNGLEANAVGALQHFIVYLFAWRVCLTNASLARQLLCSLPLAFAVWLGWLIWFYFNSLLIRALNSAGVMRSLPRGRAQTILIGALTTVFAAALFGAGGLMNLFAGLWITAVALNLVAAAILRATQHEN